MVAKDFKPTHFSLEIFRPAKMFSSSFYVFHSCSEDVFNGEKEATQGYQAYKEVTCPGPLASNEEHIYTGLESQP